eukprot:jgi/Botrbrau1/20937/Bobra.0135s0065.1
MLGRGEAVSPCERRAGGGKSEGPKKKKKKPILCVKKHRKWGRTREIPQMPDARKLRVLRKDWPSWCKSEEENRKTNTMWYQTENEVLKNTGNSAKAGR